MSGGRRWWGELAAREGRGGDTDFCWAVEKHGLRGWAEERGHGRADGASGKAGAARMVKTWDVPSFAVVRPDRAGVAPELFASAANQGWWFSAAPKSSAGSRRPIGKCRA